MKSIDQGMFGTSGYRQTRQSLCAAPHYPWRAVILSSPESGEPCLDALDLVARVTARVIDKDAEDDLYVSMFDHGGSAGGYENTWGTGKLYFGSMKIRHCRIHNRPAYNSEVHSSRDMGVDELNYAYEDYQNTDTILLVGTNPVECQTNLFLNHMVKGMQNGARVIVVDPRRTVTVDACEQVAGPENVLHLAITSGSDLALFNTLFTHIADQGWVDADFIAQSTFQGDVAVTAMGSELHAAAQHPVGSSP